MIRGTELYDISTRPAVGDACIVYKGTERTSGRVVVLKLLLPEEDISHPLDVEALLRDAPDFWNTMRTPRMVFRQIGAGNPAVQTLPGSFTVLPSPALPAAADAPLPHSVPRGP